MSHWQSGRVRLCAVEPADISPFAAFDDDALRNVDAVRFPQSKQRLQNWFDGELAKDGGSDAFRFVAETLDGEAIGTIDTFRCNRRFGTFKYGLVVAPANQAKGYAREMVLLVLRHYFYELGYQKVTPHVYSFNAASMKLHDRMGFKREGQLRNMVYARGEFFDEIHYGMTRDEFDRLYAEWVPT